MGIFTGSTASTSTCLVKHFTLLVASYLEVGELSTRGTLRQTRNSTSHLLNAQKMLVENAKSSSTSPGVTRSAPIIERRFSRTIYLLGTLRFFPFRFQIQSRLVFWPSKKLKDKNSKLHFRHFRGVRLIRVWKLSVSLNVKSMENK